jgi:hypothetical protein
MSSPFTRRLFLGAAAALPATAAAAAAPALLTVTPAEDSRLTEIGEQIDPALLAYRLCFQCRRSARALAESLAPPVPPELIESGGIAHVGHCDHQCDVEGKILHHEPQIIQSDLLQGAIDRGNLYAPKRTKFGKRIHALLKTARAYEAGRDAAIERSGITEAAAAVRHAACDLEILAYEVREIVPLTMAGVVIVARVLSAHAEAELDTGAGFNGRSGSVLGRELASAVRRLASGHRAALA